MKYELSLELLDSVPTNNYWFNRVTYGVDSLDLSYVRVGDDAAEVAASILQATKKSPIWCEYHGTYHSGWVSCR